MSEYKRLLIAKQKDAKFLKDDYKLGWLYQDETGYYWSVWGSSKNLELALNVARELIAEKGYIKVLLSEIPIERNIIVNELLPELKEVLR